MNATTKRPTAGHVYDDPRYKAAAARYSAIVAERDALKQKYEEACLAEHGGHAGDDAVARYLAGTPAPDAQPSAKLLADLNVREAALIRQRQEMDRIAQQVSGEICAAEKTKHDALAKRLAAALRETQEAERALSIFTAGLTHRGVQSTFPVLAFVPARQPDGIYSVDGWQAKYAKYLG